MSFGDTFKALSDPTRREILNLLKQGSMTADRLWNILTQQEQLFPIT